jgi:tetratricopeptide (TPR) repeat protein
MFHASASTGRPDWKPETVPSYTLDAAHDAEMAKFAEQSYRPGWSPVPFLAGDSSLLVTLNKCVKSTNPSVRARSAFLLGQTASSNSLRTLRHLLHDPDRTVKIQAGLALGCMGDKRGVRYSARVLSRDYPDWMKYYAIFGLWRVHSRAALRDLRTARVGDRPLLQAALNGALHTKGMSWPKPTSPKALSGSERETSRTTFWRDLGDKYAEEADWWFHHGDYEQIIRCEEVNLFVCPGDQDVYSTIAYYQWSLGRDADARRTLNRGIKAAPKDSDAYFNLGEHYMITKRYALAENPLKRAVDLGGTPLARRAYAHCLERLGKIKDALDQWNYLVTNCPTDPAAGVARQNRDRIQKLIDAAK